MSILKVITKTVVTGSVAGQRKVKKYSKLAKLQLELKIEKERKEEYFKEIGKHVHMDQSTDLNHSMKVRHLREQITTQDQKIKHIITQINRIKRINLCSHCGYAFADDHKFCTNCSRSRK